MSKSKGNVVYPEPIVEALNSFGAPGNDALRYYLLREAPFGQDMSFSYDGLIQRFNSDLANDLGNLANRTITILLHKLFGGKVPAPVPGSGIHSHLAVPLDLPTEEQEIEVKATETVGRYRENFDSYKFSQALECAWELVARINKYLVDNHPWTWLKEFDPEQGKYVATKPEHLRTVLYTAAEALRFNAVMLYPVFPSASEQLWEQLGCEEYLGKLENQRIDHLKWGQLEPGTKVGKPEPIFPRLDKAATLARLHELAEADLERDRPKEALKSVQTETGKTPEPRTPSPESRVPSPEKISIEDFAKVDMRVGEIVSAEPVAGAKKLTKLRVDIGTEVRQVVAGIAEYYTPEQLLGMKVVLVTNLQPRKLRGVESNGMIVAATVGAEERPVLVTFKEDVPNGARLK
jgi:methionyl-tRNA synthetase